MVRFKLVPEPATVGKLREVHQSVPADPEAVDDCCAHLVDTAGVQTREAAEEWLLFLRGLGLVAETDGRYYRLDWRERHGLADSFEKNIVDAEPLIQAIDADGPLSREELREVVRDENTSLPENRPLTQDTRIDRLLDWGISLGILQEIAEGYDIDRERVR